MGGSEDPNGLCGFSSLTAPPVVAVVAGNPHGVFEVSAPLLDSHGCRTELWKCGRQTWLTGPLDTPLLDILAGKTKRERGTSVVGTTLAGMFLTPGQRDGRLTRPG